MNVDFLIIGAQKSGTTWLSNIFNSHPEISFNPSFPERNKEWNFFVALDFLLRGYEESFNL